MSRRVLVRNQITGRVLPCCGDNCDVPGDDRHAVHVPHDSPRFAGEQLVYVFCSERHAAYWRFSHRSTQVRGQLPTGSRGLLGPLGLPL